MISYISEGYHHFVLTRFNFGLYSSQGDVDAWMGDRFDLFESFCLPSIKSQNCKNFTWLVLFDPKTPQKYRRKIWGYKEECRNYFPVFYEFPISISFLTEINKRIKGRKIRSVITTRFDNDDAISVDFIQTIQNNYKDSISPLFINLLGGYVYDTKTSNLFCLDRKSNSFISVVERIGNHKNIFGYGNHLLIEKSYGNTINIEGKHWIQIVHNGNLMNKIKGVIVDGKIPDRFKISIRK